jgi:hypothetical protein
MSYRAGEVMALIGEAPGPGWPAIDTNGWADTSREPRSVKVMRRAAQNTGTSGTQLDRITGAPARGRGVGALLDLSAGEGDAEEDHGGSGDDGEGDVLIEDCGAQGDGHDGK